MRRILWISLIALLQGVYSTSLPVLAAETRLDQPGTYLIEISSGRAVRLGRGALVAWAPDGGTTAIAEIGAESTMPRLHLVAVPDGQPREVTIAEQGEISQLRWAPDGSRLAFTLTRVGPDPGPALMLVDPTAGTVRQLVRGSIGELTWTPDSTGITAVTLDDAGGSIVTFDVASGEVRETVPDAKDASCQRGLAWSADGAYLAFGGPGLREGCGDVGNWGLWTWEPATRTVRQIFHGAADSPLWLADGDVVAMVSEPHEEGIPPLSIVRVTPDGGQPRTIARDVPRMFPQPPRLMQVVGNTILFPVSTCDLGQAHLWSPGRAGSVLQTPADVYAYRPALAPDGRLLAYIRIRDGAELVVTPTGPGMPRVLAASSAGLQVGTAGPFDAGGDWSPDGKWIAVEVTEEQFKDCVP